MNKIAEYFSVETITQKEIIEASNLKVENESDLLLWKKLVEKS